MKLNSLPLYVFHIVKYNLWPERVDLIHNINLCTTTIFIEATNNAFSTVYYLLIFELFHPCWNTVL